MLSRPSMKWARHVPFLLAAAAAACQRNQPPQPPPAPGPAPAGTQSRDSAFWVSGWGYCLRPVQGGPPAGVEKSREVWRDLFPGMAKDAKTRELLTRLHGGWPAELFCLNGEQARDKDAFKAPPPAGVAVVLRVADLHLKEVKARAGPVPFREIAFGRVV